MDTELALLSPEPLAAFNRAGVLDAADLRVALALCELSGHDDPDVILATALAVRAPRLGHVFVDLDTVAATATSELEDGADIELPWPPRSAWAQAVADADPLVGVDSEAVRPLRLDGTRLYLDRYWRAERRLAAALAGLAASPVRQLPLDELSSAITRLFQDDADVLQRTAATSALLRRLTVIAGGPGTGKTTTVAAITALFSDPAISGGEPPLIALCAPTGKAAARMQEAVHGAADSLPVSSDARERMLSLRATTIHRLLGWLSGGGGGREQFRWRHNAENRLPHDVVIVDETSMVALAMMDRLVAAVRSDAQLILVGDPDQLTAIEAGAVLRDIVGPAALGLRFGAGMRALVSRVAGEVPAGEESRERSFGDGVVVLRRGHRFGAAISDLAEAIRLGDPDTAMSAIAAAPREIAWLQEGDTDLIRDAAVDGYAPVVEAARRGDASMALASLSHFRLLCAHRRGPYGVAQWTAHIEQWLAAAVPGFEPSPYTYAGKPLLVTENDQELRLSNGDTGVIVTTDAEEALMAAFERDGGTVLLAPSRLAAVEPLYAMTIHKSQGSQFDVATVVLPEPTSRALTRELLYTAVTRTRGRLILVGSEESLRTAIARPVARATGLQELLWT